MTASSQGRVPAEKRVRNQLGRRRRAALERLEERALMAVLPTPTVLSQADASTLGTTGSNPSDESSPSVAVNPLNPNQLVEVFTRFDPSLLPGPDIVPGGSFSADGGKTWAGFNVGLVLIDPTSSPTAPTPYLSVTDVQVAFDRSNHFYVLMDEHDAGTGPGTFLLNKFDAANLVGGLPTKLFNNQPIDAWTQDADLSPVLAVDSGVGRSSLANLLSAPSGAVLGPDGNLYVASTGTNQVLRYNGTSGAFIDIFTKGTAPLGPDSLTFGPDNNLYVSAGATNQVLQYNGSTGVFNRVFAQGGGLSTPRGLRFGSDGNLYVASSGTNQVLRYLGGTSGAFDQVFVAAGNGGLSAPQDVIFDPAGNLYVSSTGGGQVLKYGSGGGFISVFTSGGNLAQPEDLAFIGGNLYVSTGEPSARVLRFDAKSGVYLDDFVVAGSGGLSQGRGVLLDGTSLLVVGRGINQVNRYSADTGAFLGVFTQKVLGGGGYTDPTSLAVQNDPEAGNVYVAWTTNSQNSDNKQPAAFFNPNAIRVVASSDGGAHFGAPVTVNDGAYIGIQRNAAPAIAVSQGTADGRVPAGQVTLAWNDFGSMATATPVPEDVIRTDVVNNAITQSFASSTGAIATGTTTAPATTSYIVPVSFIDPRFAAVSGLTVNLLVDYTSLGDLGVTLVSPGGVSITLVAQGLFSGAAIGRGTGGTAYGATFEDDSTRSAANAQAPYVGSFRPAAGLLAQFDAIAAGDSRIAGDWRIQITNTNTDGKNTGTLTRATLNFDSGTAPGRDVTAAFTTVRGILQPGQGGSFPTASAASPFGIGPAPTLASDNTLGSFSPNQGDIYLAYVDRYDSRRGDPGNNATNPADNTEVMLATSTGGGASWGAPVQVNSDAGKLDGTSGAIVSQPYVNGRAQFQPALAVDQSTGTLVASFLDTRDDAARARTATYLTASIDGGRTFSPQTFANTPNTATDEITGRAVTLGPVPDNQSASNGAREAVNFAFGTRQGLAALGGKAFPAWSSNANAGPGGQNHLDIEVAVAAIGAGPRIISSTEGPPKATSVLALDGTSITYNAPRADGNGPQLDGLVVTFDRPVDPSTFTPADVVVQYRDASTSGASAPTATTTPTLVVPLAAGSTSAGSTTYLVRFPSRTLVGTYSYQVGPRIGDRIRYALADGTPTSVGNNMDQNADGTAGQDPRIAAFTGLSPGDVYAVPRPSPTVATTFSGSVFAPPYDTASLPLQIVGPHVAATIDYPAPPGQFPTVIPDQGSVDSSLTIGGDARRQVTSLTVTLSIVHPDTRDLVISLIAPDGTAVVLARNQPAVPREPTPSRNYASTTFDDAATAALAGVGPFTGTFRPASPLLGLVGKLLAGTWTLRVQDTTAGNVGTIQGWSLTAGTTLVATDSTVTSFDVTFDRDVNPASFDGSDILRADGPAGAITGLFIVAPDPNADPNYPDPDPANPKTYKITLPPRAPAAQIENAQLGGTYSLTLGPNIASAAGDLMDVDGNAGLDNLRNVASAGTTPLNYATSTPTTIGDPSTPGVVVDSTISVPDSFTVQGVTLSLNITYPNDPDLTVTLISPGGGQRVQLFGGVGQTGNHANFINTALDDKATTPIQNGGPPFFGTFLPQQPLGRFATNGVNSLGLWTLEIADSAARVGTLNSWSLTLRKPVANTGLGQPVADRTPLDFRVFTLDPTIAQSGTVWTAVGPAGSGAKAANLNGEVSGRVTGLAVDPSDPSGNTVYVGGASGGVWRTNNFLTTDPKGPTYLPLTDNGPVGSLNIGGLAVFARNGDPDQSIVVAGTGDGNALGDPSLSARTSGGLGFLLSPDGGRTWSLLDSTDNTLPFLQRDHRFLNTATFKVVADPKLSPTGDVILYAALADVEPATGQRLAAGPSGGLWRSLDTGRTWTRQRAGEATDVLFDFNSPSASTGNLNRIYVAFQGDGVYTSPDRGQVFTLLAGTTGDPLILNNDGPQATPVPVGGGATPNGPKGRITLAKPALAGDAIQDLLYQGWLYAAVATPGDVYTPGVLGTPGTSHLDGLYLTKDFGQNWTKVALPTVGSGVPTNDNTQPSVDPTSATTPLGISSFGTANFALALAVDPTNPNVTYLGGSDEYSVIGLIRVDATGIADAHDFYLGQNDAGGAGATLSASTGVVAEIQPTRPLPPFTPPLHPLLNPTLNLIRDPAAPFVGGATILVTNTARFANTGAEATWTPFDRADAPDPYANPRTDPFGKSTRNQQRILTMIDPQSGKTRLIFADDQGVYTAVANADGTLVGSIGGTGGARTAAGLDSLDTAAGQVRVVQGSRNGNLQLAQFLAGAAQPSNVSAQVAALRGLFYGNAQGTGQPQSDAAEVDPTKLGSGYGSLSWAGGPTRGNGNGIATEQNFVTDPNTGVISVRGIVSQYKTPETLTDQGRPVTDFYQVDGIGRTFGLLQVAGGGDTVDPQYPFRAGFKLVVNPLNGDQQLVSSASGNVFATEDQGRNWSLIGDATQTLDGSNAPALAYGAPDPSGPGGVGNLNNLLYAGTLKGKVFVTQTGGGGQGNAWANVSKGLDGGPVEQVITSPTRGSHEAYAVTAGGAQHSYAATFPNGNAIPAGGSIDVPILVTDGDYISQLSLNFNITHPADGELKAALIGPDGSQYPLFAGIGGGGANFTNTTLADPSTTLLGGYGAPRIDSQAAPYTGTFGPVAGGAAGYLSDSYHFVTDTYGKLAQGNWTFRVTDKSGGVAGSVGSATLNIVSLGGVYHNANAVDPKSPWQPVAGNVFRIGQDAFGTGAVAPKAGSLSSIVADWRYVIPDNFANPGAGTHPLLYAAGNAGVYRSTDGGVSWSLFPAADPGSLLATTNPPGDGGGLPSVAVADLDLALGAIDPTNGRPRSRISVDGNPANDIVGTNVLLATTYGRGSFAIRLAPSVFPTSLQLDAALPAPGGSDSGASPTDQVTNVAHPYIDGFSEQSAFGNTIHVNLLDLAAPSHPVVGTGTTDASGRFSIQVTGTLSRPGNAFGDPITLGVQATDDAGSTGNIALLHFTLDTVAPVAAGVPALELGSDTGTYPNDDITKAVPPTFLITPAEATATVQLLRKPFGAPAGAYAVVGTRVGPGDVNDTALPTPPDGAYDYASRQTDLAGNLGPISASLTVTIDTTPPVVPAAPDLEAGSDTGASPTDNVTMSTSPTFDVSVVEPRATVELFRDGVLVKSLPDTAPAAGVVPITDPGPVPDGIHTYTTIQVDLAGNPSPLSPGLVVVVDTIAPVAAGVPDLEAGSDTGPSNTDNITSDTSPIFDVAPAEVTATVALLRKVDGAAASTYVVVGTRVGPGAIQDPGPVPDGLYDYASRQTDLAGNLGPISGFLLVQILTQGPTGPPAPDLEAASDSGPSNTDNYTNVTSPIFDIAAIVAGDTGQLLRKLAGAPAAPYAVVNTRVGVGAVQDPGPVPDGVYLYADRQVDLAGNLGPISAPLTVTIDTTAPLAPGTPDLEAASDTGVSNTDNITADTSPFLDVAPAEATATVALLRKPAGAPASAYTSVATRVGPGALQDVGPVPGGMFDYAAQQTDLAGNLGPISPLLTVTFVTVAPASPPPPVLEAGSDTGVSNSDDNTADTSPVFDVTATVQADAVQLLRTRVLSAAGSQVNLPIPADAASGDTGGPASPVTSSTITVGFAQPILDVNVVLNIAHARDADLTVSLVAPDGTVVNLVNSRGAGAKFAGTTLDDQAGTAIGAGASPFSGVFRPEQPLSGLAGKSPAGTWTLRIKDNLAGPGTIGTLLGWSLIAATANDVVASRTGTGALQDPGPVADGVYQYATRQVDPSGLAGPLSLGLIVTIDTTAPLAAGIPDLEAASDSGVSNTDNITSATIVHFPIFDVAPTEPMATVQLFRNGILVGSRVGPGAIQDPGPAFPDGVYLYTSRQTDLAGNVGPMSGALAVTIDNTAPGFTAVPDLEAASDTGVSNTDNITADTSPVFDVVGVEAGATLKLLRDGVVVTTLTNTAGGTVPIADAGPVPDGVHQYSSIQIDVAGNVGPVSGALAVTIDTQSPTFVPGVPDLEAASDSGPSSTDNYTNVTRPTFDIAPVEAGVAVQLLHNGVVVGSRIGPGAVQDTGPLTDGVYTYTAREVDGAGNLGTASGGLAITVDTQVVAPGAPDLQAASDSGVSSTDNLTNVNKPTFDVAGAESTATLSLLRDGVAVATRIGSGPIQDPGPVADGPHVYSASQVDLAGNASAAGGALTVTIDTVAPAPPGPPKLEPGSDDGPSNTDGITSITNPIFDVSQADPTAAVELRRNGIVVAVRVGPGPIQDSGLADGTYSYTADQRDAAGNISAPSSPPTVVVIQSAAPVIPAPPDLQAGSDSGVSNTDNLTNAAQLVFDVFQATTGNVVTLYRDGIAVGTAVAGTGGLATPADTTAPEGVHVYTDSQHTLGGPESPRSAGLSVTVDRTGPAGPALSLDAKTDTGALGDGITSSTTPLLDGKTEPGAALTILDGKGNALFAGFAGPDGSFSLPPTAPLSANAVYALRARATDAAGNLGPAGPAFGLTISTAAPATPSLALLAADDSGLVGDNVTNVRRPRLVGTSTPGATLVLIDTNGAAVGPAAVAGTDGGFTLQPAAALATGQVALRARATSPSGVASVSAPIALTILAASGDYDGDGHADLATFRGSNSGFWSIQQSSAGPRSVSFGTTGDIPQNVDFDGDGKPDIAVYRPATGQWFIQYSSGIPSQVISFGQPGVDIPVPADYDGDHKADLAVYRPTTGQWFILRSTLGPEVVSFGQPGVDQPIPADFDGDGKSDLAVYRPTTGQWFVLRSTAGPEVVSFGQPGVDVPLLADFDGDGKTDIAVYRPTTAQWLIQPSGGGPGRVVQFGAANLDVPVPQDYDGDGKADIAVYRPTTSQWLIQYSGGGAAALADGSPNDVAVPAPYPYRVPGGKSRIQSVGQGAGADFAPTSAASPAVFISPSQPKAALLAPAAPRARPPQAAVAARHHRRGHRPG